VFTSAKQFCKVLELPSVGKLEDPYSFGTGTLSMSMAKRYC